MSDVERGRVARVPAVGIDREAHQLEDELKAVFERVLTSGRYILGEEVAAFEREIAEFLGVKHAVSVASGTDALVLALRAVGIGPGDYVATSAFTFFATGETIVTAGATPVFLDIEPGSFNLDPSALSRLLAGDSQIHSRLGIDPTRVKAVVPVHLFGKAADMTSILEVAGEHGLSVIEDTAQAMGAKSSSAYAGTVGHAGCYSFFPTKNLGCLGDGGLVVTGSPATARRVATLKTHGSTRKYIHDEVGVNSRLDALQAAILRAKAPHLDAWLEKRRAHARAYDAALRDLPGITTPEPGLPGEHSYNQYTIRIANAARENVREMLDRAGVDSTVYYPLPLHLQPAFESLGYEVGDLPEAERASAEVLSLPIFPAMTEAERERVISAVREAVGAAA